MEVVYAADHAHFVPQLSGNTRSLLYAMPIPSSYVFSPGRLLLRLDYTSLHAGCATAAGNSDIYVFDSEENLLFVLWPHFTATISPPPVLPQSGLEPFRQGRISPRAGELRYPGGAGPGFLAILSAYAHSCSQPCAAGSFRHGVGPPPFLCAGAKIPPRPFSWLVQRASQLGGVTPAEEPG